MRPMIGLTTFIESKGTSRYSSLCYTYIDAIIRAGGIPVLIPITEDKECLIKYADAVDGIIFTGGEDVSPLYFGENPIKEIGSISCERDACEMFLFKEAYDLDMPILGICRGSQLINVALGGSLYQDINAQLKDSLGHSPESGPSDQVYHMVKIEKDSKLYNIFENDTIAINSFHHQSVKELGKGLKAAAFSYDGIIEATESVEKGFVVGIQWHPEALAPKHPIFMKLFEEFISQCR